MSKKKEDRMSL